MDVMLVFSRLPPCNTTLDLHAARLHIERPWLCSAIKSILEQRYSDLFFRECPRYVLRLLGSDPFIPSTKFPRALLTDLHVISKLVHSSSFNHVCPDPPSLSHVLFSCHCNNPNAGVVSVSLSDEYRRTLRLIHRIRLHMQSRNHERAQRPPQ